MVLSIYTNNSYLLIKIGGITVSDLSTLSASTIQSISASAFGIMSASTINTLTTAQLNGLTISQLSSLLNNPAKGSFSSSITTSLNSLVNAQRLTTSGSGSALSSQELKICSNRINLFTCLVIAISILL